MTVIIVFELFPPSKSKIFSALITATFNFPLGYKTTDGLFTSAAAGTSGSGSN